MPGEYQTTDDDKTTGEIGDPATGDRDIDAAEYVLGVLSPNEARAIEALAGHDAGVAASIAAWQDRLSPLAAVVIPLFPPAELWQRLALASGLQKAYVRRNAPRRSAFQKVWGSPTLWRATTIVATVLAAGMAFLLLSAQPAPEPLLAALSPQNTPGVVFLVRVADRGLATIIPVTRLNTPINRSLELWAVAENSTTPVSLGLMPGNGRARLKAPVRAGMRLLVSQEPTGGSTTGIPTGPIVYAGLLTNS